MSMTRTLAHTDVTHVSSSSSYMYPPPPHMTRTLAHTDVSSIDMYNNEVGPCIPKAKKKKASISFMCIHSPLHRLRYCTCLFYLH